MVQIVVLDQSSDPYASLALSFADHWHSALPDQYPRQKNDRSPHYDL
jgi:hypothetical protein